MNLRNWVNIISTMISVPVSVGEWVDKMSILDIKASRIMDPAAVINVRFELDQLKSVNGPAVHRSWYDELKRVNEQIWDIEDEVRSHESREDFGDTFVAVARQVYILNDKRAQIKRDINKSYGSGIIEEKNHVSITK
jgi:hypothetical protein